MKTEDIFKNELLSFLEYEGTNLVLVHIRELATLLHSFKESFSGTTALRKLLECKEAYLRALQIESKKLDVKIMLPTDSVINELP